MQTYIYYNDLFKYLIDKNIIDSTYQILFSIGLDNYVLTVYGIQKNGTDIAFVDLTGPEQTEVNHQLRTNLSTYRSLIDSETVKLRENEIRDYLSSGGTIKHITKSRQPGCYIVIR